ncbi:hypothetical protein [Candidatus Frankia alpina]|uniref:hypothetical protein n=1 Tax=Candidatus Frankia alpina TaxID=2699483 RepID=UPI0013D64328|nr:hypothetical protein [Candidatus Frankia alpina]
MSPTRRVVPRPAASWPLSPRNRVWRRTAIVGVLGPMAIPRPDQLRDALYRLAAVAPGTPLLRALDPTGSYWRHVPADELDQHIGRMVRPLDAAPPDLDGVGTLVSARLADPPVGQPLRIFLGDEHVLVEMSHVLGDGSFINRVWSDLLSCARDGGVPELAAGAGPALPLARAFAATFGRHPGRLLGVVRSSRPQPTAGQPTAGQFGVGGSAAAAVQPSEDLARPAAFGAGVIDPAFVYRQAGPELLRAVRRARAQGPAAPSTAAIMFAAAWSAAAKAGLPEPAPGLWVLFDVRRYLPGPCVALGNFATGVYLEPADPGDPGAVTEAIRAVLANGRPVATMAVAAAKQLVPPAPPAPTSGTPAPTLAVSFLTRNTGFESLPWHPATDGRILAFASTPGGPSGITVTMVEVAGSMHVSISFDGAVHDRKAVAVMAELLCTDLVSLVR